jgi:hypothetical protein
MKLGAITIALVLVAALLSCQTEQQAAGGGLWGSSGTRGAAQVDGERVRNDLFQFADEATAEFVGVASVIAREAPDTRTRELMLTWRLRSAGAFNSVVLDPDPRRALVNTWLLVVQNRKFVTNGGIQNMLTDEAHISLATETVLRIEDRLEKVIRSYVPPEVFADAEAEIDQLAEQRPINIRRGAARLTLGAVTDAPAGGGIGEILALPLAPLTGLQGVSSTAQAIDRIAVVLSVITEIVEDIPQQVRWQAEAMLLELESGRTLDELRRAIARADEHIVRTDQHVTQLIGDVDRTIAFAESLPPEIDRQREATLQAMATEREEIVTAVDDLSSQLVTLVQTEREAYGELVDELLIQLAETADRERTALMQSVTAEREAILSNLSAEREIIVGDTQAITIAVVDHAFRRLLVLLGLALVGVVVIVLVARTRWKRA